jgi:4-aminobutyrate aminotransferase
MMQQRPIIKTELPGPKAKKIIEVDQKYVTTSFNRYPYHLAVEKGYGIWIEDTDGNVFMDCNAGIAVCSTGHCHPEVVEVIQKQAETLIHMCGTNYYYRQMPDLAKKLDELVPIKSPTRTYYANSGAEAVEAALKLAMYHTKRQKFISFIGSFHGRSLATLSLTASKRIHQVGYMRKLLDVTHVPYPTKLRSPFANVIDDDSASKATIDYIENIIFKTTTPAEDVAGIVVEALQGEGGYFPAPQHFLKELRRICNENGILLIVDEVHSGMGRTGKMFATDYYDVEPDIMCMSKGIGSGLPIAVCVARADVMNWPRGSHASTFGGNPVCIAAALKTIELLENGLTDNARIVGQYLKDGLTKLKDKYDCIGDVRGRGLMIGVEIVESKQTMKQTAELRDKIEKNCYDRGLLIFGGGGISVIRWAPPLIMTKENVDVALEIFDQAIEASI